MTMIDAKDPSGVFRTIDGATLRWTDRNGAIHAVEGADVHRGVRLLWTLCERDVPADTAFKSAEPVTCERCHRHEPHGALDTYRAERMRAKGASSEAADEGSSGAANAARPSMISLGKNYATRSGRAVRLLMVDGGGDSPVIGAMMWETVHEDFTETPHWEPASWTADGFYAPGSGESPCGLDLVEIATEQRSAA